MTGDTAPRAVGPEPTRMHGAADPMLESELARRVFAAMKDIVLVLGRDGEYLRVPTTGADGLYAPSEVLVGRTVRDVLPGPEAEAACQVIHAALEADRPVTTRYALRINGREVHFAATVTRLDDASVVWVARDVTAEREAGNALRASEARYRLLFDRNPAPMWVHDEDTLAFLDVNEAAVSHYGYSRDEFLRMTLLDIHPAVDVPSSSGVEAMFRRQWARQRHRRRDGGVIEVEIVTDDATVMGPRARLAIVTDVTARVKMETQLLHAQKMDAVGVLAGGLAHDFNNILTAIQGHAEFLLHELPPGDDRREDALSIQRSTRRAAVVTEQLLAFSRKQILRPTLQRLNAVVTDVQLMLRQLIGDRRVRMVLRLHARPDTVVVDRGQLEQVITNLCVNAREAMPAGGTVTIATRTVELDELEAALVGLGRPGAYVRLDVSDTGIGIPDHVRARLFEPFFTTKGTRRSGLGLSTVHGIVTQSGGVIDVVAAGSGSTFTVMLPVQGPHEAPFPSAGEGPRESETVLLVEDEVTVRALAQRILARQGYTVLEAPNGHEALAVADAHDGPIHLLLTDAVMPRMSGAELASRMMTRRPTTRVLFMTGQRDEGLRAELAQSGYPVIEKPFAIEAFSLAVRARLEGAGVSGPPV